MPTAIESIENFLRAKAQSHNGPDLLERWSRNMETQLNVSAGKGEAVEKGFSDGVNTEKKRGRESI